MYIDLVVIKKNLEAHLLTQFGHQVRDDVFLLIEKLAGIDTFVDKNLLLNLQNILSLNKNEVSDFIQLAHELALVSAFAPVLLLEKIPTLIFYEVTPEIMIFLSNIKNYGARAIALFLGSDQLKTEDLLDVLEQTTITFYKALLAAVNARHQEFGVCCAMIMRNAAKLEQAIRMENIPIYLDLCSALYHKYGAKLTEEYIKNAHECITLGSLDQQLAIIDRLTQHSLSYAELRLIAHKYLFLIIQWLNQEKRSILTKMNFILEQQKTELLKSEDYLTLLNNPLLFDDLNFASLVLSWPKLNNSIRTNILFQLEMSNYKQYILTNAEITKVRESINQATRSNWLEPWMFCGETIDLSYIRKKMGALLQKPNHFLLESKTIVKQHSSLFDRSNTDYTTDRVLNMLNCLLNYSIDATTTVELTAMAEFLTGNSLPLRDFLSRTTLIIQTWSRDPWIDYGRSDELFSCTSLGDYNAGNAPGFLSDLNLNHLDIWSHGARVGRIHLCLVKNADRQALLLLDCVDGTERIIASRKKAMLIMSAVLAYASWLGVNQIKINFDIDYNTTPKKFITSVKRMFKEQDTVDFVSRFLTVSTSRQLLPFPCQTFLESFVKNNGGFVRGLLIATTPNRNFNEN